MKILRKALGWIFPPRCPYCGKVMKAFSEGCPDCSAENIPFSQTIRLKNPMKETGAEIFCCSPFLYEGKPRKALVSFKFHGRREFAEPFGVSSARCVKEQFPHAAVDLICPVPLSRARRRRRGYDQAFLLARETGRNLGIPCKRLLVKKKENRVQHELSYEQRWSNVEGVYGLKENASVQGKTILLCDDVVTSGATLMQAAEVLLANGAKQVYGVCFCRAMPRKTDG